IVALGKDSAGSAELDYIRSVLDGFADLLHYGLDTVCGAFRCEVKFKRQKIAIAMASRDSKWGARNLHARTDDITGIDSVAKRDIGITFSSKVANRGESRHQSEASVLGTRERSTWCGDPQPFVSTTACVRCEVSVNVEETGQECGPAEINNARVRGDCNFPTTDGFDVIR